MMTRTRTSSSMLAVLLAVTLMLSASIIAVLGPDAPMGWGRAEVAHPANAFSDSSTLSTVQTSASANWHIECVDCPKSFSGMTDRSLRLDTAGHPHIAYGGDHLYYAWHDGAQWHYETVDESPGVGWYASLALDSSGWPCISYYDNTNGDLKYAWRESAGWQIKTVDSAGGVGQYASLVLDRSGQPHIGYYGNGGLKYAWYDGTVWHIETVDNANGAGDMGISLAVDGLGQPHIGYYGSSSLRYAWYDGSGWHIETVDSTGVVGEYPSLALDGAGRPYISYYGHGNSSALKYAWYDGTAWHIEIVDRASGEYTSLVLDNSGQPHISYLDAGNRDLKYAWYGGSGWQVETVDSTGDLGWYTSLVLDGLGRPHISYYKGYPGLGLKYAWHDGTDWRIETLDNAGDVGGYTSLALDESGRPHISYYDWGNGDLKHAWYDEMAWRVETVDSGGFESTSLAVDSAGRPDISYADAAYPLPTPCPMPFRRNATRDETGGGLKYAWHDGMSWQTMIVDSEGSVGGYSSLALDGADRPHISYFDYSNADLKYGWYEGIAWQVETVDSSGMMGRGTSLMLDKSNRTHISYWGNGNLKYAYRDAADWYIQIVDSAGGIGEYTSLALDESGYPHISYSDSINHDLKYAYWDTAGWHIQTVDSAGNVGQYTSLALDSSGYPHISYLSWGNYDLKYAWRDGSGWHIETVDSTGDVGWYISLTLDELGQAHISYYDSTNGDLKYAWRETSFISGHVRDSSGNPVPNIVVSAGTGGSATTDVTGAYTITILFAGTYVIRPQVANLSPAARVVRVPPNVGDQDFTTLPVYGTLVGRVTAQGSGNAIANARVSAGGKVGQTDANGNYTLPQLLPGVHTVYVSADSYKDYRGEVTIRANTTTTQNVALEAISIVGYYLPYPGGTRYQCTQGNGGNLSHQGTWYYAFDFGMPDGRNVVAARAGRVVAFQNDYRQTCYENTPACLNAANYVRIRHPDGTDTLYWHLKYHSVTVRVGDPVRRGQVIAKADTTGYCTGPHLDFTRHAWGQWNSIPISFVDVAGDGVPQASQWYTSSNYLTASAMGVPEAADTDPPRGSVQLRLTGQPTFTLQLSAFDYASDVTTMRLAATEADLQAASWQLFTTSVEWTNPAAFAQYQDANGNVSSVVSDTIDAIGYEPIQAAFATSPTICVGSGLSLTNQTTPFCEQCGWIWDFGNGATSKEAEPQFDYVGMSSFGGYATPGTYTVTLTVSNALSASSASHQVTALPTPSAEFTLIRSGATITVEAELADNAGWIWSFGDGATATGRIATHTYTDITSLGTYPVQLVAEGNNGCSSFGHRFIPIYDIYLPVIQKN